MHARTTVALLALASFGFAGDPPSADDVAAAVANLDAAFGGDDEAAQVAAIQESLDVVAPEVIARIAAGLDGTSRAVESAAIETLGWMKHADALKALHGKFHDDAGVSADESLFIALLRAIGRHGDPSSLKVLAEDPFEGLTLGTGRVRIFAVANIRTKEAIDTLIGFTRLAGPKRNDGDRPLAPSFRVALLVLTGADRGATSAEWDTWWRESRDSIEVGPERPAVPGAVARQWEEFWGEPYGTPTTDKGAAEPRATHTVKPTREEVDAAVAELKAAAKSRNEDAEIAAVKKCALLVDARVISALAGMRRSRSTAVAIEAFDALGRMPHKDALRSLQKIYRGDQRVREDEYLLPALLKAMGRHSDPSSLNLLKDKPLKNLTRGSGTARILGIARIRTRDAVEALLDAMLLGGGDPRGRRDSAGPRFMGEMRVALAVLTGVDNGTSKEAWQAWWRENKKGFSVPEAPPPIPDDLRSIWESYWGEPYGAN